MKKLIIIFAAFALTAGCITDDGLDEADDEATSAAIQELGSQHHHLDPLVRQNTPLGKWVYEQLGKGWLRWAMELPWSTGPISDPDGSACGLGQSGPVWYLAGTSAEPEATRSCTVPRWKPLFFPLINTWVTPPPSFITPTHDEAYFTALATDILAGVRAETCSLTLRLDGHAILPNTAALDAALWSDILDPFPVLFNDDNFTGGFAPGGVWPLAYMGGHFALLLPLPPGDHVLEFGGARCDAGTEYFSTKVTWNLHVQ